GVEVLLLVRRLGGVLLRAGGRGGERGEGEGREGRPGEAGRPHGGWAGQAARSARVIRSTSTASPTATAAARPPTKAARCTGIHASTAANTASSAVIRASIPPKTMVMNAFCERPRAARTRSRLAAAFAVPRATPSRRLVQRAVTGSWGGHRG